MFKVLWQQYRTWADTSARLKQQNTRWKRWVLALTIAGTALTTLGPFAGVPLVKMLPVAGAVALALATYFGKELLDSRHDEEWTRARAAAEALKSEACKYLVKVPPYDGADRVTLLKARIDAVSQLAKDQQPDDLSADRLGRDMPTTAWSVDDYRRNRLDDQIEWYRKRAGEHARSSSRGRWIALALGVLSVVLSAITGATADGPTIWGAILGVITTTGGSIGAYFQAGHFAATALKYRETARSLETLEAEFRIVPPTLSLAELVSKAETIMQAENAAWLTELTAKS